MSKIFSQKPAEEEKFYKLKDEAETALNNLKELLEEHNIDVSETPHDIADICNMLDELERDIYARCKAETA